MPVLEQPSDVLPQFRHGDLDAFETLFRQHQTEVYRWIVRIVGDKVSPKTSPLKPSGASIAPTRASILHVVSGPGRGASPPMLRLIT